MQFTFDLWFLQHSNDAEFITLLNINFNNSMIPKAPVMNGMEYDLALSSHLCYGQAEAVKR